MAREEKREVRQGKINSKYKRIHSWADTDSQKDTANHLAKQDASRQALHKKVMSQYSPWKEGMERRFTAGLPLSPVFHRSKFTPCGINSPVLPCCLTQVLWQSLEKPDPTPIGYIWVGEQWEEPKSLGLSFYKGDHLGSPPQRWLP